MLSYYFDSHTSSNFSRNSLTLKTIRLSRNYINCTKSNHLFTRKQRIRAPLGSRKRWLPVTSRPGWRQTRGPSCRYLRGSRGWTMDPSPPWSLRSELASQRWLNLNDPCARAKRDPPRVVGYRGRFYEDLDLAPPRRIAGVVLFRWFARINTRIHIV